MNNAEIALELVKLLTDSKPIFESSEIDKRAEELAKAYNSIYETISEG